MKSVLTIAIFIFSNLLLAQIQILDNQNEISTNSSTLLKFKDHVGKGILLPTVTSLPSSAAKGTMLLDAQNATKSRIKVYNGTTWEDFSQQDGNATSLLNTRGNLTTDLPNSKVVIGYMASTADGALVLESSTQTMALPIVTDVNTIGSPSAGMMVYVLKPDYEKGMLAFYNGTHWSFWQSDYTGSIGIDIDPF